MKKKFKVVTLGCRSNQYESQAYSDQLREMGYTQASEEETADVCIVNTCTVTESADKKSFYQIRKLRRANPSAKIAVTGCLAEREKKALSQLEGVEFVVPNKEKEKLLSFVFPDETLPEFSIKRFEAHTRAFVKIQDGCNSYCSYCIIPFVRGRSRSRKVDEILREIEGLVKNGYKEIVLTGINIGDFDGDVTPPARLSDLIRKVDQIDGLERIRVSSIDPDEVDDDLLDAIINGKKTCPSMHIVLQAGSNVILKRMNRKYTRKDFYYAVDRLLDAHPNFTFTTDIIVGFPGETMRDFKDTLKVIDRVKFAKVHMFPYSVRPKTRAARFTDHLPSSVIEERRQQILRFSEKCAFELRERFVGQKMKVLLEDVDPFQKGCLMGHTENFLPVSIPQDNFASNDIVEVVLENNTASGFVGHGN